MECPKCGHDAETEHFFGFGVGDLGPGDEFQCSGPGCGATWLRVTFDERYDGVDEYHYWGLELA